MAEEDLIESDLESSDDGREGGDADDDLSYVARAALDALLSKHGSHRNRSWGLTHGKVIGDVAQSPVLESWGDTSVIEGNPDGHSDSFVDRIYDVLSKAERWIDITSLSPPDGKFHEKIKQAITEVAARATDSGNKIVIRLLFGNIIGMPVDTDGLMNSLTADVPKESNMQLWVGSWRRGVSWNHSKIVAVDGTYLFTGGHNLWDPHYLQRDPVHDLSMEAEGQVANDGHVFANKMWKFIKKTHCNSKINKRLPDWVPVVVKDRANISSWPSADECSEMYAPMFEPESQPLSVADARDNGDLPIISCGRYGALHHNDDSANPSDSAITAMLDSVRDPSGDEGPGVIRMSLQDLGPIAVPGPGGGCAAIPGGMWPAEYLRAIGMAMYEKDATVQIALSNPGSVPGGVSPLTANYGNGWTCNDVASEIIKAIQANVDDADEDKLRSIINDKLFVTYLRTASGQHTWESGASMGNHAKFFMVDDLCYYIGSQNLYVCNLAEWGLVIDDKDQTDNILNQYWNPLWEQSFQEADMDENAVMEGLGIDRDGGDGDESNLTDSERLQLAEARNKAKAGSGNVLTVWIKSATNLKDADGLGGGSSDSYVRLRVVDPDDNTISGPHYSSVCQDGGADPVWNDVVYMEGLHQPASYTLKVTVLDKDSVLGLESEIADNMVPDDKLGAALVDLGTLECSTDWQDQELTVCDGWFSDSTVTLSLNTSGSWGN